MCLWSGRNIVSLSAPGGLASWRFNGFFGSGLIHQTPLRGWPPRPTIRGLRASAALANRGKGARIPICFGYRVPGSDLAPAWALFPEACDLANWCRFWCRSGEGNAQEKAEFGKAPQRHEGPRNSRSRGPSPGFSCGTPGRALIPPQAGLTAATLVCPSPFQEPGDPPFLDGPLQLHAITSVQTLLNPDESPWTFESLRRLAPPMAGIIMLLDAEAQVAGLATIESSGGLTSKDIDPNHHRTPRQNLEGGNSRTGPASDHRWGSRRLAATIPATVSQKHERPRGETRRGPLP
jgi:hypothetical protein